MYEIRLCKANELALLKKFLKNSWSQNHIFLKDSQVLDFQHRSIEGYNFVVAYHILKKEFHGVLGIVSKSHYSKQRIVKGDDIWLAIWKVDKNLAESPSIGTDLLNYIEESYHPTSISAIGINKPVSLLYKLFGYKVKTMNQWFIPNLSLKNNNLISGQIPFEDKLSDRKQHQHNYLIKEIDLKFNSIQKFLIKNNIKKDNLYIENRYMNHPSYSYKYLGIFNKDNILIGFGVGREVVAKSVKAMRFMELFLEPKISFDLSKLIQPYLINNNLEYLDFLEYGFDDMILESLGFIKCSDSVFVPHHFEPFEPQRKEVLIAYKSKLAFSCTKGDSDLDRPNISGEI